MVGQWLNSIKQKLKMTDFLLLLLFGVCWTWGFRTPFQEGYFLEKIGKFFRSEDGTGTWFTKPLFDCPPCQASLHGFMIASIYYGAAGWNLLIVFGYMICLCGLNFIIKSILYPEYE
jgi:hypothetical protein